MRSAIHSGRAEILVAILMETVLVDEILDVIDENDVVVSKATRKEVHSKGLPHRAVHIFLFNTSGQIYVQRRSASKDSHPLKLDSSAAGHLDSGENYAQAAARELLEELSINSELKEEFRFGPDVTTDNEKVALFTCRCNDTPSPNVDEIIHGSFWNPADLSTAMSLNAGDFVPAFVTLWTMYGNIGK